MSKSRQAQGALIHEHAAVVEAAAARIFPTTSTPGATEAGVVNYIDRLLIEAYPKLRALYQEGCRAFNRHAKRRFGSSFLKIPESDRDQVLADFEAGRVPDCRKASEFFETLRSHTMEGVFGEPQYGGNRDLVGWKLVGFPGHQFGYPDPYINRPVDIEPVAVERPYPNKEQWRARNR